MYQYILRRLMTFPLVIAMANVAGFVYAYYLRPVLISRRPLTFHTIQVPPVVPSYLEYLKGIFRCDFGTLPNGGRVSDAILHASAASTGILFVAFLLSIAAGVLLGRIAVRTNPPVVSGWLMVLSSIGQASPIFFIGGLFISASVIWLLSRPGREPLIPFQGFGWDAHMVLPVLALMVRPTLQISHTIASFLSDELAKPYILVLRGMGHSRAAILGRFAYRNILAMILLVIAGCWRMLIVELIILERLFNWPGLGRLFSSTIILSSHSENFLFPPLTAALFSVLVLYFLIADLVASIAARTVDPRLTMR